MKDKHPKVYESQQPYWTQSDRLNPKDALMCLECNPSGLVDFIDELYYQITLM